MNVCVVRMVKTDFRVTSLRLDVNFVDFLISMYFYIYCFNSNYFDKVEVHDL